MITPFQPPYGRLSVFGNVSKNLPFTGSSADRRFLSGGLDTPFNPGMTIKWLPLKDVSTIHNKRRTEFENQIDNIRLGIKKGDTITALSMIDDDQVVGMVHDIKFDYNTNRIRIYVSDLNSGKIIEIYPESTFKDNF